MASIKVTETAIANEEAAATEQLKEQLQKQAELGRLNIEPVTMLVLLGSKVVVPILCSFVSRAMYEEFKTIQTRRQVEQARKKLASSEFRDNPFVDEAEMSAELVQMLTSEGISQKVAQIAVEQALARARRILARQ